jgi:sugar (pentulose or hexulose) kinase
MNETIKMSYLGIDIGTSAVKGVLIDDNNQ